MVDMFGLRTGENQDVIKIYKHKLVQYVSQNIIDQILEHPKGMTKYS